MGLSRLVEGELLHDVDATSALHATEATVYTASEPYHVAGCDARSGTDKESPASEREPLLPAVSPSSPLHGNSILVTETQDAIAYDAQLMTRALVREELVLLAKLSVPMLLATTEEFVTNTVQAVMVGHVHPHQSAQILAAFILANLLELLLFTSVLEGISTAIDALCASALADVQQPVAMRERELWLFVQAGLLVFAAIVPVVALTFLYGAELLSLYDQGAGIAHIAGRFLAVSALAIPFAVGYALLKSVERAQDRFAPVVYAALAGWIVSDTSSYVLAYHTRLGYLGLALAGPIDYAVQLLVLLPDVWRSALWQRSWPGWRFRAAATRVPRIVRAGVPNVLLVVPQLLGFLFTSLLAGLLQPRSAMITANGIFTSILALVHVPLRALAVAGSVRIGLALTAGRTRRAVLVSRIVVLVSVALATGSAVVLARLASPFATAFTPDPDAVRLAVGLSHELLLALLPLLGAVSGAQAVLYACGKHLRAMQLSVLGIFAIGVPVGLHLSVGRGGQLEGLWLGNIVGTAAAALIGLLWVATRRWTSVHAHKLTVTLDVLTM